MTAPKLASHSGVTMPKRIIYTRFDGGVDICAPSQTALRFMTNGGGRWPFFDRGFYARQIDTLRKDGINERNARRFINAMQYGGCTDAEAYEIMRDRFCVHLGTGCELWDTANVSRDRWFRNAWVRSHNGGPINIDLVKARSIQQSKIEEALRSINKPRIELGFDAVKLDWGTIADQIKVASDDLVLRRIWPSDLKQIVSPSKVVQ